MRYIRALDGVRGAAVLLVMLFHFGYLAIGWVGVQIFFVLSGYLITNILLENRDATLLEYVSRFYWRRAMRIFPLYYAFLFVVAVTHAIAGVPTFVREDLVWLFTFTANFARIREGDLGPSFVHLWSLAVEEQFYLMWPLLLYLLPTRYLRWVPVAIIILAPVARTVIFQWLRARGHDVEFAARAVYVLPVTQFDAFAAGAAISILKLERIRNAGHWFLLGLTVTAIGGAAVLAMSYIWGPGAFWASLGYALYLEQSYGYIWAYSLINLVSAFGIVCALQGLGPARMLEKQPFAWIGRISYGIYVYHLPLLFFGKSVLAASGIAQRGVVRPVFFVVWLATVVLISSASFRLLETPFLKLKGRGQTRGG